ncbi:MAG TPA: apolipoprotein N-acyltransferase [Syntrophales bacterium]|nr:apolipoprotein N-acyltransferase [Syntrophales bacterium]
MQHRIGIKDLLPWIAAVAGGVLAFLGYAGFDQFYLEWICLVPILWAIREQSPGRAFLIGWIAGIVGHGGGFYWIIHMFQRFAGMAWPLAVIGLLLIAAANGIVFAVWAWATRLIIRDTGWNVVWVSPVIWTALEKFWPEIFPNYLGASQYKLTVLTQIADVTGILGLTFLVVYINSVIYAIVERLIEKRPFSTRPVVVFTAVIVLVMAYGAVRIKMVDRLASATEKLVVGVVQINLEASEKYDGSDRLLREHQKLSKDIAAANSLDLIVWSESICAIKLASREGNLPSGVLGNLHTPTLFGAVLRIDQGSEPRFYNSAVLADEMGKILGTYDKMVLVPFGEYIPFGDTFTWLYSWSPYSSRFWPGENEEPLMLGRHPLSVNICYEDIFPGQIRMLMNGGRYHLVPEAIFNLTDDSWYGDTVEPTEHLALASFRSIEHRRPLVRATNTGISAIVDPVGRIDQSIRQWTRGTLVGRIPLMRGRTVYAVVGDWLGWLCTILTLLSIGRVYQLTRHRTKTSKTDANKGKKHRRNASASHKGPRK